MAVHSEILAALEGEPVYLVGAGHDEDTDPMTVLGSRSLTCNDEVDICDACIRAEGLLAVNPIAIVHRFRDGLEFCRRGPGVRLCEEHRPDSFPVYHICEKPLTLRFGPEVQDR